MHICIYACVHIYIYRSRLIRPTFFCVCVRAIWDVSSVPDMNRMFELGCAKGNIYIYMCIYAYMRSRSCRDLDCVFVLVLVLVLVVSLVLVLTRARPRARSHTVLACLLLLLAHTVLVCLLLVLALYS